MREKLKDIAIINMGYSFRERLDLNPDGNVSVVQIKDLGEDPRVNLAKLGKVKLDGFKDNHMAIKNDIIFKTRGVYNTASIINEDAEAVIVAAPLLIIRITKDHIMPEYLNWFINHPKTQLALAGKARGTSLMMISKQELGELEISIPSLKKQGLIVELAALAYREQHLLKMIADKKKEYMSSLLMKKITGVRKEK